MNAAVVNDFAQPPAYVTYDDPVAEADEVLVRVRYAAQSSLAKAQAAGRHYSRRTTPFIPGVDGVGEVDGRRVYFAFPRSPYGSMAELVPVRREYCVDVPEGLDDASAAAAGNPGMSSLAALTYRAKYVPGESILINGATGVSGRLAVRVAKHLGAKHVLATGRSPRGLELVTSLGADVALSLERPHAELVADLRRAVREYAVDVVLDYLWGAPAAAIVEALSGHGSAEAERRVRFVQIGSMAGATAPIDGGLLRSSGLELLGSGLGSVSFVDLVRATASFFQAFVEASFAIDTTLRPLRDVATSWNAADVTEGRVVYAV